MSTLVMLDDVLHRAARVRVTGSGVSAGRPVTAEVLVDETDPAALDQLREALAVESAPGAHCMCIGDVAFEFTDADGQTVAVVGLHHGISIRWSGWASDAFLTDGRRPLRWLADRGADAALRRFDAEQRRRELDRIADADWVAAIPAGLEDMADRLLEPSRTGGGLPPETMAEFQTRLSQALPDPTTRALALLAWCGSGSGRCSGHPVHEETPSRLLRDVPIAEIIAALQDSRAGSAHRAGAVRHLVGWHSRKHQKRDVARLPAALRSALLDDARAGGDRDTTARAESWLA